MLLWAPDDEYEIVQVFHMEQIDSWNRGDKTDDAMILNTNFRLAPFYVHPGHPVTMATRLGP